MTDGLGGAGRASHEINIWQTEDIEAVSSQDLYENDSISKADQSFIEEILGNLELGSPKLYQQDTNKLNQTAVAFQLPDDTGGSRPVGEMLGALSGSQMEEILNGNPEQIAQMEKEGLLPEGFGKNFSSAVQSEYNDAFFKAMEGDPKLKELGEKHGLSNEAMQSRVAYEYMTQNPKMSSDIKEYIDNLNAQIMPGVKQSISQAYGAETANVNQVLSNWASEPNSSGYMAALQNTFEDGVKDYIQSNAASPEAATRALNAFYGLENAKVNPEDIALAKSAQKAVQENLQSEGIVGPSFEQTPGSNLHAGLIESNFAYVLQGIAADPKNPTATEIQAATAQIQAQYQLNAEWKPSQEAITATTEMTPTVKAGFQAARQLEEMSDLMKQVVDRMPAGPEKDAYINFLKVITEALDGLKQLLFQMQLKDSGLAHKMTRMERDMNIYKIDKEETQRKEIEAAKKKQESKAAKMKIINIVVAVVASVALIAMAAVTGPVALMVAMVILASTVHGLADSKAKGGFLNQGMAEIDTGSKEADFMIKAGICAAVVASGSGALMGAQLFFTNTTATQDLAKAWGADEMTAQIIAMSAMLIFTLGSIYAASKTAGATGANVSQSAAGASKSASGGARVANDSATSGFSRLTGYTWKNAQADASTRLATKLNRAEKWKNIDQFIEKTSSNMNNISKMKGWDKVLGGYTLAVGGLQATEAGMRANYHLNNAKIALQEGELDQFLQEIHAMIKILKQVLQKLLNGLDGPAEFAKEVQAVLDNVFSEAQKQMNQITQA
ncbi:MAG: hypothetical protein WD595_04400 [Waddliaceae bacterium]